VIWHDKAPTNSQTAALRRPRNRGDGQDGTERCGTCGARTAGAPFRGKGDSRPLSGDVTGRDQAWCVATAMSEERRVLLARCRRSRRFLEFHGIEPGSGAVVRGLATRRVGGHRAVPTLARPAVLG
jgi:hypothetical protein